MRQAFMTEGIIVLSEAFWGVRCDWILWEFQFRMQFDLRVNRTRLKDLDLDEMRKDCEECEMRTPLLALGHFHNQAKPSSSHSTPRMSDEPPAKKAKSDDAAEEWKDHTMNISEAVMKADEGRQSASLPRNRSKFFKELALKEFF